MKEKIFERRFEGKKGLGLFLAREILSITGITLTESGTEGQGARFVMLVPEGAYRFADNS
jgi:signal transduction histidine kinase